MTTTTSPSRKRANGDGSLRQLANGKWEARWYDRDGNRRGRTAPTRGDAARLLRDALKARDEHVPHLATKQTTSGYLEEFLAGICGQIRPSTWRRYEELCRLHAAPAIGRVPLVELEPMHLQRLYSDRIAAGFAPKTVRHLHAFLHRALRDAHRHGLVARNVAELARPPRVPRHEMHTLDGDQVRRLLRELESEPHHALFVVAVSTGMRLGELLALRWKDVDLDAGRAAVRGTLTRDANGPRVTETKTGRARVVLLTPDAIDALRRLQVGQADGRLLAGSASHDGGYVFTNDAGRPLDPSNVRNRMLAPALKRAGLDHIRFHDLRHTAATLMLSQNVHPKVVSEMLGHSQISITLDLYSHVTPTMQQTAVDALQRVLSKA